MAVPAAFRKGRAIGIVGVLTVTVAIFGYVREAALAARFGVSATMDAYFAAIFVANVLYGLLITGTLSPLFIPILLHESVKENSAKTSEAFSHVANFVMLVLLVVAAASVATARFWVPLFFGGFDKTTTNTAVHLTYIIFPAVLFLALAGILTATLNAFHKFALAAFAPALASIAVIAGVALARGERAIYVVGVATTIGFIAQGLMLIPATRSLGIRYQPTLNFRHPAIRTLLRQGIPLFLYLAAANGSALLERNLASQLSAGAVSTVSYALRLFLVPANFLISPLATVVYPGLAREAAREHYGDLRNEVSRTLRLVFFFFLPTTLWVVINALPITRLLYERGHFHLQDSLITSHVLAIYSVAILPYAATVIALKCFYAMQDTVTPLKAELVDLAYFIIVATLMTRHFGLIGLVASRASTFFLVAAITLAVLAKKLGHFRMNRDAGIFLLSTLAATAAMSLACWASWQWLEPVFDSRSVALRLLIVGIQLAVGFVVYFACALLLRIKESRMVLAGISRLNSSEGS